MSKSLGDKLFDDWNEYNKLGVWILLIVIFILETIAYLVKQ